MEPVMDKRKDIKQRMAFGIRIRKMFTALAFIYIFCLKTSLLACVTSDKDTTICDNVVPVTLPPNTTRVYINIFATNIYFSATSFAHMSWQNVIFLDITAQYSQAYGNVHVQFGNMCFSLLYELKELRMHGEKITTFSPDTFDGVHLKELQFSVCRYLEINNLTAALLNVNITVESLSLNDVSDRTENDLIIGSLFYNLLKKMKVCSLSLRKTGFKMNPLHRRQIKPTYLKTLDISQTNIILPNKINISTRYRMVAFFIQDLKTLNISSIPAGFSAQFFLPHNDFFNNKTIRNCSELSQALIQILFTRIENLYANALFLLPVIINNTLLNISDCHFSLKKWHFKQNKIQIFNITIYLPLHNEINEIDFSYNKIKYLSPLATKTVKALEILNLKSNELFQMEYLPEFNDLLEAFTILKYFNIAENELTHLPQDIFRNNVGLEMIDLADNELTTIEFNLIHLKMLRLLNIARNRIKLIDGKALANVKLFLRASAGSNYSTVIEMAGNPFICSCESVRFMEWIISVVQQHTGRKYLCKMKNEETEINNDSLYLANFSCYRETVIICASVASFIVIVVSILFTKFILRHKSTQKEKYERKHFLKDFRKGVLTEQYLCQISYASEDEMCALDIIHANLNIVLNRKCRCKREIICSGDKNFCLGRPIVDEIFRCISKSCVVVFVISKSFCESRWCEMELREAYEMDKPIILIFKETVKTSLMPKLLLTLFNKITRVKLVLNEGNYVLIPEWESLGESIIKLATEQFIAKQSTLLYRLNET